MQFGFCGNCCLVLSSLGFVFFFYITIICLLDPERLHIVKHRSKDEDDQLYTTAWTTSATCSFLYLLIAGGLYVLRSSKDKDTDNIKNWLKTKKESDNQHSTYELAEYNTIKDQDDKIKKQD